MLTQTPAEESQSHNDWSSSTGRDDESLVISSKTAKQKSEAMNRRYQSTRVICLSERNKGTIQQFTQPVKRLYTDQGAFFKGTH